MGSLTGILSIHSEATGRQEEYGMIRSVLRLTLIVGIILAGASAICSAQPAVGTAKKDAAKPAPVPEPRLSFRLHAAKDLPSVFGVPAKPEDNAAPLYEQAVEKLRLLWDADDESRRAVALRKEFERLLVTWGIEGPLSDGPKPGTRDPAKAREFLKQFAEALALRDQAAARPFYRRDADWSKHVLVELPHMTPLNVLARLSFLAATVDAHEGKADSGYQHLAAVLHLAGHLEQETVIMTQLMAISLRVMTEDRIASLLHDHPPSAEAAARFKPLRDIRVTSRLKRTMIAETTLGNGAVEDVIAGKLDPKQLVGRADKGKPEKLPPEAVTMLKRMRVGYLEFMDRYVRACGRSARTTLAEFERVEKETNAVAKDPKQPNLFVALLAPAASTLARTFYQDQAQARMTALAIDIAASRKDTAKPYPKRLIRIPAHLILKDPFNDKQFGYRRDGKGFVLWSVGPDGDDDGGKTYEELEAAGKAADADDGDLVLRIPPAKGE